MAELEFVIRIRLTDAPELRAEVTSDDPSGSSAPRIVLPGDDEHRPFLLTGRDGARTRDRARSYPSDELALRAAIGAAGHTIGTRWARFVAEQREGTG
jgi:hypothetical protein